MAGEESMSNGAPAKCRTCLMKATSSAPSLFDHWRNGTSTIALDLARLTGVLILDSDPHSKIMCHTCCSKLHNACKFVDMVQESERHLRALEKSWPKPIQLDKNVSDVVYGNEDVQVKEEVLSEEDPFDTNDADEFNPDMDIKIEPEELVQPPPIEITVNESGMQCVTILDENASRSIKTNRKRKKEKEMSPISEVLSSLYGNEGIKKLKKAKSTATLLKDLKTTSVKTDNISLNNDLLTQESKNDLELMPTDMKDNRRRSARIVKKIEKAKESISYKSVAKEEEKEKPTIDLILEVEEGTATIDDIAKHIANNNKQKLKHKPTYTKDVQNRRYLKHHGKAYVTSSGKKIPAKEMGPPCRCRKDIYCNKGAFTEEQRNYIFNTFWAFGDPFKQAAFIIKFTTKREVKVPNCTDKSSKRDHSFIYFLPVTEDLDGEKVRVCRIMFANTLGSYWSLASIWKKYENSDTEDLKNKRALDKITSVCEHFGILQEEKLSLLEKRAKGLYKEPIGAFGIRKMFSSYCEWFDYAKYSARARTYIEYEQILFQNVPRDNILTFQRGDGKPKSKPTGSYTFYPDDEVEEKIEEESVHSNFSEELDELKTELKIDKATKKMLEVELASDETSASESETEVASMVKTRKSAVRKTHDAQNTNNEKSSEDYKLGHIIGESFDVQFLTNRGRLIVMRPPCSCKLKCFEKVPEGQRELVFKHFWGLGKRSAQWGFLLKFTKQKLAKTATSASKFRHRYDYFLPSSNEFGENAEKVKVCNVMFSNTLRTSIESVKDLWQRRSRNLQDRRGLRKLDWMTEDATENQDQNKELPDLEKLTKIPEKLTEIPEDGNEKKTELNVQDYTLQKKNSRIKKLDDIEFDNTNLDFLYKSMSWDEFINAVSVSKRNKVILTPPKKKGKKTELRELNAKKKQEQIIERRMTTPPCECKRKCVGKMDEDQRTFLFNFYMELEELAKQWAFIIRFTERLPVKRHRIVIERGKNCLARNFVFNYFLPATKNLDGSRVQVCQHFFANTLGVSTSLMRKAWKRFARGRLMDKRGHTGHGRKVIPEDTRNSVRDHTLLMQEIDPNFQNHKLSKTGWLKFKMLYQKYVEWLETSQYPVSCKPSARVYRVLLYQAAGYEIPEKWLNDVNL